MKFIIIENSIVIIENSIVLQNRDGSMSSNKVTNTTGVSRTDETSGNTKAIKRIGDICKIMSIDPVMRCYNLNECDPNSCQIAKLGLSNNCFLNDPDINDFNIVNCYENILLAYRRNQRKKSEEDGSYDSSSAR